jgi:VanZ family protein
MHPSVKYWGPVFLWASMIFFFSTERFSSSNTSQIIGPLVQWLLPNASMEYQNGIHFFVRKLAHLTEYFVFAVLLLRAFLGGRPTHWNRRPVLWTLALVLVYAFSDELHQLWVPSRGAHLSDSLLDFFGGSCGVLWKCVHDRYKPGLEAGVGSRQRGEESKKT